MAATFFAVAFAAGDARLVDFDFLGGSLSLQSSASAASVGELRLRQRAGVELHVIFPGSPRHRLENPNLAFRQLRGPFRTDPHDHGLVEGPEEHVAIHERARMAEHLSLARAWIGGDRSIVVRNGFSSRALH